MFGSQLGKWAHWVFGVAMGICFAHLFLLWRDPDGAWLSFLGDVTGAAIGAGAAVIVAMATLDHQRQADRAEAREARLLEIKEQLGPLIPFAEALEAIQDGKDEADMRQRLRHARHFLTQIRNQLTTSGALPNASLRRVYEAVQEAWSESVADIQIGSKYDPLTGVRTPPPLPSDFLERIERVRSATVRQIETFQSSQLKGL